MKKLTIAAVLLFAATSLSAATARTVTAERAGCPNENAVNVAASNASQASPSMPAAPRDGSNRAPGAVAAEEEGGCFSCYWDYYMGPIPGPILLYGDFKFEMCKAKYCAD
ncbi:MAG TPA: hypothetical protein VFN10_12775 [Thermoanaerobaculia bacterium]|nr:hypothetical protein [Thermoanaerobaculia bacterium]